MPGVTLSVTQMVILSLNEFIFLLGGYSLNRQKNLPCKICRGAFRPSAFLIKLAWEAPALGQVAGAQFMQCDENGLCEATGGGQSCWAWTLVENGIWQALFGCRTLGREPQSQLLPREADCPGIPVQPHSHCTRHRLAGQAAPGASARHAT